MIMVVTLGDLVAQGVVQEDYSLSAAALAVTTFCVLSLLLAWTHYRFPVTRPLLSGRARVVVRDGAPLLEVLSSEHLTIEDVEEAAREKGIRRLRDIEPVRPRGRRRVLVLHRRLVRRQRRQRRRLGLPHTAVTSGTAGPWPHLPPFRDT